MYDSYMFLIEADGKRIWHTGDYREHGYLGKGLFKALKVYAKDIDVLITEGTMLNCDAECIHEREVSRKMSYVMKAFKYVFVIASSSDIERLASINSAAKKARRRLCVNSGYMNAAMHIFTQREKRITDDLFTFRPIFISDTADMEKLRQDGFVLVSALSKYEHVKDMIAHLPSSETILIYSSWDGYYKLPEQIEANPMYKQFREAFGNVVDIHTSGHADRNTIKKVIDTIKPKEVICIHKEANATL